MRALPQSLRALLVLVLATSPRPTLAFENDFSAYPSGSQACLTSCADASECTGNNGTQMNECLCTNGGNFIYNTAACVATSSPSDLTTVYATLENNCDGTGVIITVGQAAFLAQASAAVSSAATATATGTSTSTGTSSTTSTTTTSSPTSSAASTDGLSTGAKVGIGAGIGLASIGLLLAGVFIWVYNRRRRPAPGGGGEYTQTGSPPGEYSSSFGAANTGGASTFGASTFGHASPHPSTAIPLSALSGGSGWISPGLGGAEGMYYKPQDAQQTMTGAGAGQPLLAELDNSHQTAPVEMYAPPHSDSLAPGTQQYGFHAELPGSHVDPARYQSPPGSHSPYSPPYERSHF